MAPEDLATDIDVLADNVPTIDVFMAMSTQWRSGGMGGAIGLDYTVLPSVMRYCGISRKCEAEVFSGIRIMESQVLSVWRPDNKS